MDKTCINCTHCVKLQCGDPLCAKHSEPSWDPVYGQWICCVTLSCKTARRSLCGPEGKDWRRKRSWLEKLFPRLYKQQEQENKQSDALDALQQLQSRYNNLDESRTRLGIERDQYLQGYEKCRYLAISLVRAIGDFAVAVGEKRQQISPAIEILIDSCAKAAEQLEDRSTRKTDRKD